MALRFKFVVTNGTFSTLRAKVIYGSEVEEVKVEALPQAQQTLQGKTVYTFTTRAIKASEFSSQLGVRVYNGTQKISRRAIYSVNRCLDKLHYATSGTEKALIDAIYSYGKASAWYAYFGETDVTELPARWENGIYDLEIFDYRYDDARMLYTLPSYVWGDWTIWLNGETYTTGMSEPVVKEGYQVAYEGTSNTFTVTLDGADIYPTPRA